MVGSSPHGKACRSDAASPHVAHLLETNKINRANGASRPPNVHSLCAITTNFGGSR